MDRRFPAARRIAKTCAILLGLSLGLSGCVRGDQLGLSYQRLGKNEVPTPLGSPVRDNRTPMEAALACFGDQLLAQGGPQRVITVGDVKDFTGKYSISEGNAITQGGALMVYSALGKIGGTVGIAERFDPTIAERELGYTDRRQLGDGNVYEVNGSKVPWVPYFGGSITKSDYFIVGGITELNYNIGSGGGNAGFNNIGFKGRTFTENVAIDLRIVDSRSLMVVKTISLTKQFTGYEVGASIFRFFGTDLFDINIGAKGQEPLQLGVRTALEEATMRLVAAVSRIDPEVCMARRLQSIPQLPAEKLRGGGMKQAVAAAAPAARAQVVAASALPTLNSVAASGAAPTGKAMQIGFEFGDVTLQGNAQAALDQIVQQAANGPVEIMVIARDTENWDPAKRDSLLDQRIAAVVSALANRGIAPGAVLVSWRPDKSDTSIHRDGPGMQEIARIQVRK